MTKNPEHALILFTIAILLLTVSISTASAETWYVDDDGGADFTKIQDAIDNASAGDTIFVKSGTYYENVVVNKSLTLRGEDKNTTIIYGTTIVYHKDSTTIVHHLTDRSTIKVTADYVNISGFTVKDSGEQWYYAGIHLLSTKNNTIIDNIALDNANGILLEDGIFNNITKNICKNNIFDGIYLRSSSSNTIANNIASNNSCGIYLEGSSYNTITNNTALNNEDGIYLMYDSDYNIITNNTAFNNGGGIYLGGYSDGDYPDYNIILNNNVKLNDEYGIYIEGGAFHNELAGNEGTVHRGIHPFEIIALFYIVSIVGTIALLVIAVVIAIVYILRRRGKKEFCPACGAEIKRWDKLCSSCGARINVLDVEKKAGAGARFVSFIIDLIIVSVVASILCSGVGSFYIVFLPKILTELTYNIILRVFGLAIYTGYFTYFLGNGQTIGMKAVKIKLCGTDGTYPIGYKKGFLRWVGMTISNLVIGLGYLWILKDENKQGWHDKIAGTYVVVG